jgi:hypothetical protein
MLLLLLLAVVVVVVGGVVRLKFKVAFPNLARNYTLLQGNA